LAPRRWRRRFRLKLPYGLTLSFQRFVRPPHGLVESAPASLGALPVAIGPAGSLLLPVAEGEAFWVGLGLTGRSLVLQLALAVEVTGGGRFDAISGAPWDPAHPSTVEVPGRQRIEGVPRSDGHLRVFEHGAFGADLLSCDLLRFRVRPAPGTIPPHARRSGQPLWESVVVEVLDYETFDRRTGLAPPEPIDPNAGYAGWRLP
jgi:hypothetical protein